VKAATFSATSTRTRAAIALPSMIEAVIEGMLMAREAGASAVERAAELSAG
jgi:hypothetical protein